MNNYLPEWVAQTTCCLSREATRGFRENIRLTFKMVAQFDDCYPLRAFDK